MSKPFTPRCLFAFTPLLLAGCALQAPYVPAALNAPSSWSDVTPSDESNKPDDLATQTWWKHLNDPAIDALIDTALADNPTLLRAIARMDEARAAHGASAAQELPALDASGSLTPSSSLARGVRTNKSSALAGLSLRWEIDLFERLRNASDAARFRLDARSAEARGARLVLASQVAQDVLSFRACSFSLDVLAEDIRSREKTLELTRQRLAAGAVAPVDEARALGGVTAVRTSLAARREECARYVNALTALTGEAPAVVRRLAGAGPVMPDAPGTRLAIPAMVVAVHPDVVAAEREVAAAWADIGVARAERMPRIELSGLLSGQWLHAAGSSLLGSLGAGLSAPLFDGGRGAAEVDAASARLRASEAVLRTAVRTAVQDVENALAAIASAVERTSTTKVSVDAAQRTLLATEAQWRAGAVSLFELEDARRQLAAAQDGAIAAARDSGQAWIALVRASGNHAMTLESI